MNILAAIAVVYILIILVGVYMHFSSRKIRGVEKYAPINPANSTTPVIDQASGTHRHTISKQLNLLRRDKINHKIEANVNTDHMKYRPVDVDSRKRLDRLGLLREKDNQTALTSTGLNLYGLSQIDRVIAQKYKYSPVDKTQRSGYDVLTKFVHPISAAKNIRYTKWMGRKSRALP